MLWWSKHEAVYMLARWRVGLRLARSEWIGINIRTAPPHHPLIIISGVAWRENHIMEHALGAWIVAMAHSMSREVITSHPLVTH